MKKTVGFTLIELLIVVAIIGILAAIAVPAYFNQAQQARRADGIAALEKAAARMEQYFFQFNQYTTDTTKLGGNGATITSQEGHYTIRVTTANNNQEYTLTAKPTAGGAQTADSECQTYTLNYLGQKTSSPSATTVCWK